MKGFGFLIQRVLTVLATIALVLVSSLLVKVLFFDKDTSPSDLQVETFPRSDVYLNDKKIGTTPIKKERLTPGKYKVRLIPVGAAGTYSVWEGQLKLVPGSLTFLSRDIGRSAFSGSGQTLYLEKIGGNSAQMMIVSTPDGAKVVVDGLEKGKAPLLLKDLEPGDKEVRLVLPGFADQRVNGRVVSGYRLQIFAEMAHLTYDPNQNSDSLRSTSELLASPSAIPSRPYVTILETPVGFLRMRKDPFITSPELGQVNPNENYHLEEEIQGWVKIKRATDSGWVSEQYVLKVK